MKLSELFDILKMHAATRPTHCDTTDIVTWLDEEYEALTKDQVVRVLVESGIDDDTKVKLDVDGVTFDICMSIAAMYAKNIGLYGLLVKFTDYANGYTALPLASKQDYEDVFFGKGCLEEE